MSRVAVPNSISSLSSTPERRFRLPLALAIVATWSCASAAAGELGLVDMAKVVANYDRFVVATADLKARTTDIAEQFNRRGKALQALKQEMDSKPPGSEQHLVLKGQLERLAADLKAETEDQKRRLRFEEAQIYADAYEEIVEAIQRVADARGYDLILRFKSDTEIDRTSSEAIVQHLNRDVIFQRNRDITQLVLEQLNQDRQEQKQAALQPPQESR